MGYNPTSELCDITAVVHKVIGSREKPLYYPKVCDYRSTAKRVIWDDFCSCSYVDTDPAVEGAPTKREGVGRDDEAVTVCAAQPIDRIQ